MESIAKGIKELLTCQSDDVDDATPIKKKFQRKEKSEFERILEEEGGLNDIFYRGAAGGEPHTALGLSIKNPKDQPLLEDFVSLRGIGSGAFGKVYLVRCKKDQKIYAMKAIRKDVILDADMVEATAMEK